MVMRTVVARERPAADVEIAEIAEVAPRRPTAERWLIGLVAFQGVTGTAGGTAFLVAPESGAEWFPEEWLDRIPFDSFFWPGIILGVGLGVSALVIAYGLVRRPDWRMARSVERWTGHHWSWATSIGLGAGLTAWIVVELLLIPDISWLQPFYFTVGALIVGTSLAPSVREHLHHDVEEEIGT